MNALFLAALLLVPGLPESTTVDTAANLAPRSLDARLNHVRIFEQWSERAPEFLFDRRWDLVRVSVCGMGERRFSLSAKRENDGLKVLMR